MQDITIIRDYFNQRAAGWDTACFHDPKKLAAIAALAAIRPGQTVLDAACGTGAITGALLEYAPAMVLGVDVAPNMIAAAKEKYKAENVRFEAADLYTFDASPFDCIVLYSAYPHFGDKQRLLQRCASLLKEGGRLLVAHSESKETINGRHRGKDVSGISWPLRPAAEEAEVFSPFFAVDTCIDTDSLYAIGGVKR